MENCHERDAGFDQPASDQAALTESIFPVLLAKGSRFIIKIERPGAGDDTRKWGPPYVKDSDGEDTSESAYYLSSNRNKRSVTVDMAKTAGVDLLKRMLRHCDVLVHNFKVGGLEKYKLGYDDLKAEFPSLVYCAITGFGQTGPYAGLAKTLPHLQPCCPFVESIATHVPALPLASTPAPTVGW